MASRHQTFKQGQVLHAADLNDCLNPATADHIPFAMHADRRSMALSGIASTENVPFPAGRFTRPPSVAMTPNSNPSAPINYRIDNVTSQSCRVVVWADDSRTLTGRLEYSIIAVQMS